jgi:hypothetical protein
MSKIKRLIEKYKAHIDLPWEYAAAPQRVIFCVYKEDDELQLRAKIDEFEIVTKQAGHEWAIFDLTDTFAVWLTNQRYKKSYFKDPEFLSALLPQYLEFIKKEFDCFLKAHKINKNTVVALKGVGSLFGFLKVKEVVNALAPTFEGRLLVFFPGTYDEHNNYRLFNAYDGWNYLAFPITADKDLYS